MLQGLFLKRIKIIKEKCPDCGGNGYVASRKKISVSVPAGIDSGQSIRIREKGEPGTNGGPRGDLLVEVMVQRHPIFQRQDYDTMNRLLDHSLAVMQTISLLNP